MILVMEPAKPFTYTVKRTPHRSTILANYTKEIDDVYAAVAETSQSQIEPPATWSESGALYFVHSVVEKVMKKHVNPSDDIFQHGCDRQVDEPFCEAANLII